MPDKAMRWVGLLICIEQLKYQMESVRRALSKARYIDFQQQIEPTIELGCLSLGKVLYPHPLRQSN